MFHIQLIQLGLQYSAYQQSSTPQATSDDTLIGVHYVPQHPIRIESKYITLRIYHFTIIHNPL